MTPDDKVTALVNAVLGGDTSAATLSALTDRLTELSGQDPGRVWQLGEWLRHMGFALNRTSIEDLSPRRYNWWDEFLATLRRIFWTDLDSFEGASAKLAAMSGRPPPPRNLIVWLWNAADGRFVEPTPVPDNSAAVEEILLRRMAGRADDRFRVTDGNDPHANVIWDGHPEPYRVLR